MSVEPWLVILRQRRATTRIYSNFYSGNYRSENKWDRSAILDETIVVDHPIHAQHRDIAIVSAMLLAILCLFVYTGIVFWRRSLEWVRFVTKKCVYSVIKVMTNDVSSLVQEQIWWPGTTHYRRRFHGWNLKDRVPYALLIYGSKTNMFVGVYSSWKP